ncbi:MAG TPA: helix-turn-helix domain-containing protein [Gaiellales bacterium]|nr:helix-turn-helix domain-containing protein [Gaiellales bacterium]
MGARYGQFCPIAQAAEVLTDRWTLLVVRELLSGSTRFNELQRGVPLMSSSLLSKRLRELERSGIITRRRLPADRGHEYLITPAGEALGPLLFSLGAWSQQWLQREVSDADADPALLMWDMQRNLRLDRLPQDRLVSLFRFRDAPDKKRAWWLVAERTSTDLCLSDPGFGVDLHVDAEARAMAEVWIGKLALGAAMRSRRVHVRGPKHLVRSLPDWLGLNVFAYPDPAAVFAERRR